MIAKKKKEKRTTALSLLRFVTTTTKYTSPAIMSLFIRSARRTVSARSSILPGTCRFASGGSNAWTGPLDANTKHYVIIAEDFNEGKGLDRRLAVREQHLEAAKEGKKAGRIEWGGGLLGVDHSDVGEEGAAKHLTGSLLIVKGEVRVDC